MKLNESNAKFAVVSTAFHGGGVISYHDSFVAALVAAKENTSRHCTCGCCGIVAITDDAMQEMHEFGYQKRRFSALPQYAPDLHYSCLCL